MQNGSLHQKETVHDNDFETYLTGQSTQVNPPFQGIIVLFHTTVLDIEAFLNVCEFVKRNAQLILPYCIADSMEYGHDNLVHYTFKFINLSLISICKLSLKTQQVTLLTLFDPEQQLPVHHRPISVQLLRSFHWVPLHP